MPWSQMISTNCRPPRPMDDSRLATLPARNARILKSRRSNMGVLGVRLDDAEEDQHRRAPDQLDQHGGRGPSHRVMAIRLDPSGDADEDGHPGPPANVMLPHQSSREGRPGVKSLKLEIGPDGAEQPDRHADPEDQTPVDVGQDAAGDEADERPGDGRRSC